jgi:hypothetical protein
MEMLPMWLSMEDRVLGQYCSVQLVLAGQEILDAPELQQLPLLQLALLQSPVSPLEMGSSRLGSHSPSPKEQWTH